MGRSKRRTALAAGSVAVAALLVSACANSEADPAGPDHAVDAAGFATATPIKHVVVIFGENIAFDHYFGTYPHATNENGTPFHAAPGTPAVNGLTPRLLTANPNAYNPKRLAPDQALTCDQSHDYGKEQAAFDGGRMDKFVEHTEKDKCTGQPVLFGEPGLVMDYFDGNTVTAMWNYAQHYSLGDNSFDAVFGPSSPGAINLVSGQTHGLQPVDSVTGRALVDPKTAASPDAAGVGTMITDPDPAFDDCSDNNHTATDHLGAFGGRTVGDLLTARKVTWGWFEGGFRPTGSANGYAVCGTGHPNVGGQSSVDYSPHHEPFQYYRSTANPKHLPPSSLSAVGQGDRANHQYDVRDFDEALGQGTMPAVSFLKAPSYQDGHAGYSDPLDEQAFVAGEVNRIQSSPHWRDTAIVLAYDDSDGWYDHQPSEIVNGSHDSAEDSPLCSSRPVKLGGYADRCGYGPRLPLLVISPYSRVNHVDHTRTDQTSVLRFIEDNWHLGRIGDGSYDALAAPLTGMFDFSHPGAKTLKLDPKTGAVVP
ncbi:alkaline phosphatase family protein [Amycolatopsis sp. PS_44_ISF1]|uniref:phospholipase C n=1 Tax=Amycolatopsis sp. PS_44_ISF1 TaxID=2974917 RepID=UPI0028DDA8D2|nr:alkaline phosphatase family protein [Amycolatopsis sp. PS_44_ISF1]MDT8912649.1 alkaline phosphatase family protein [Amycolatopsis sp. PS_44_ISF1]